MTHREWALQVLFSPDGRQVMSAGVDGWIRIWDAESGTLLKELSPELRSPVLALAISPDGEILISGDASGQLLVWDAHSGALEREMQVDRQLVNAVAFSLDGRYVAAGGYSGKIRVWERGTWEITAEIEPEAGRIVGLAFSPDSVLLAISALGNDRVRLGGEIGVWLWKSGEKVRAIPGPSAVRSLAFSPDGKWLAFSAFERSVSLHITAVENNQAEIAMRLRGESDDPGLLFLWEWETSEQADRLTMELGAGPVAFSPDGTLIACGGSHGVSLLELWEKHGLEIARLDTQTRIDALAFSPDGGWLVVAREQERPAEFKIGGAAKVFHPSLIHTSLLAKEGSPAHLPGLTEMTESLTGGSSIEVFELRPRTTPEEIRFWEVRRLEAAGEEERARELCEDLAQDYPKFGEARRVLGVLYGRRGEVEEEGRILREAVEAEPNCARCYRTLGDFYRGQRVWGKAAESYQRALELDPEFGLVAGRLAEVYNQLGLQIMDPNDEESLFQAMTLLLNALALRPGNAIYLGNFGLTFYFRGKYDKAIEYWQQTLEMKPDGSRMYYNIGHAYRMKGERQKAIEAYRRYVAMGEPGEEARVERAKRFIEELSRSQ